MSAPRSPRICLNNNNQRGLGFVTGRVGYTWGPGLVYVKGGYAYSTTMKA